jgi:DNA-binding transcriptional LysR family regulator
MATLYVLPPVVARFREAHPEVEVELRPTHQRLAMESLLRYEVDAAVLASPSGRSRVRSTAILRDPLLLVGAPGAARPPTTLAGLADLTLLVLPAGTGLHDQVVGAVRRRAPTCRLVEYPTAETIKASVGVGVGVTILPRSAVAGELAAGTLDGQPIEDWPGATRVIRLLVRAEGRVPPQVSAFGELLREHYRAAVSSRPRKTAPRTSA